LLSGYALSYANSTAALTRWVQNGGAGARLVFDPGPRVATIAPETLRAVLEAALWISANASEALVLTGLSDPAEAARALSATRPETGGAIVRVGAQGAWLSQGGEPARHIAGHAVQAIDTNGAGDAHIGYFISMLAAGFAPTQALRTANVAAALSTTKEGPSTAPSLNQVNAVLALASDL
jgi:sugar/nucleoside kinase (ribokinase family)